MRPLCHCITILLRENYDSRECFLNLSEHVKVWSISSGFRSHSYYRAYGLTICYSFSCCISRKKDNSSKLQIACRGKDYTETQTAQTPRPLALIHHENLGNTWNHVTIVLWLPSYRSIRQLSGLSVYEFVLFFFQTLNLPSFFLLSHKRNSGTL